jgi:hypothetical protein
VLGVAMLAVAALLEKLALSDVGMTILRLD